jgi:PAS domain S-box-containing protein
MKAVPMDGQRVILIVEDNPITLKLFRATLESAGYAVFGVETGAAALEFAGGSMPDLVFQDLLLPDMDGIDLVRRLRELAGGQETAVVAVTGFVPGPEQAHAIQINFTEYLLKPVAPSKLLACARALLSPRWKEGDGVGNDRLIAVADDEPLQRKLARVRLERAGFRVVVAADGVELLALARSVMPAAIVSDVLMPNLDGFKLCVAVRNDPVLADVPVILMSSTFTTPTDRRLALDVGAQDLVLRTPGLEEMVRALTVALRSGPSPRPKVSLDVLGKEYDQRFVRQLEHQVATNASLLQRLSLQGIELEVLSALCDVVTSNSTLPDVLRALVQRTAHAAGLSKAALCLLDPSGALSLSTQLGFSPAEEREIREIASHHPIVRGVIDEQMPIVLPSENLERVPFETQRKFLGILGAGSVLVTPITNPDRVIGILILVSGQPAMVEGWEAFGQAVGHQIGQAIRLATTKLDLTRIREQLSKALAVGTAVLYTLKQSTDGFITTSLSDSVQRLTGYTTEEALAQDWWVENLHPEDRAQSCRIRDSVVIEERVLFEYRFRRKDQSFLWVRDEMRRLRTASGDWELVGSWVDISERKQTEMTLQRQSEALLQAEKLAAMGTLLAGVAHELNNPLSIVMGQSGLLRREVTGPALVRIGKIEDATMRCARIVSNFLALARQQQPERSRVSLNEIVRGAAELLAYPLRVDTIDVVLDLAADLPPLWADPHQLNQVLVNLVTNAHQAMRKTPSPRLLRITTRRIEGASRVVLKVEDSGPGVPAELRNRVFEPFFTTKPAGQGTGLGLSLCQGIIEGHGGSMCLENGGGRGAVFHIELPVDDRPTAVMALVQAEPPARIRGKKLLVVDDEPLLVELMVELLMEDGHVVHSARNGREGLERLREGLYDLVISDLKMPELDGPGLYDEMEKAVPAMIPRFLFLTGDTFGPDTVEFLERSHAPTLSKPVRGPDLLEAVQQALTNNGAL